MDGAFHITALYSCTNNADTKTFKIKFNGTVINTLAPASTGSENIYVMMVNRHSLSAQVNQNAGGSSSVGFGSGTGSAPTTYTINTGASIAVVVTCQLGTSTDTASLEAFRILAVN